MKRFAIFLTCLILLAVLAAAAQAVTIETVPVGNLGNIDDVHGDGYGAVDYAYNIGKYEVTAGQYTEFLNAVAASDPYGLYNSAMDSMSFGCQITRHGVSGSYTYDFSGGTVEVPGSTAADWTNRPVNYVSWGDAARFANWLHNDQGNGYTEDGAYDLSGTHPYYDPDGSINDLDGLNAALMDVTHKSGATWGIPTEDEWYKAAYYDPEKPGGAGYWYYPTKSDDPNVPSNDLDLGGNNATFYDTYVSDYTIGGPYWRTKVGSHENSESPYGTFDQGGNVWELNDAVFSVSYRGLRGGSFSSRDESLYAVDRSLATPTYEYLDVGFRVVQVPEPTTITMLLCGLVSLALLRRRR